MSVYIETQVEAENVVQAMFEDHGFALEMWYVLAEKLNMGLLLDECMDLTRGGFSLAQKRNFQSSLTLMASCLEQQIEVEESAATQEQSHD